MSFFKKYDKNSKSNNQTCFKKPNKLIDLEDKK